MHGHTNMNITAVISVHFCNQFKHRFCIRHKICPSVFRIVAMFVAVNWQTILHTKCVLMFTLRHRTIFHKASFNDPLYRVSQEECAILRESVPYVKLYRYNPKHLYPKFNGFGDNGHRKVWASGGSTYCTSTAVSPVTLKPHLPVDT